MTEHAETGFPILDQDGLDAAFQLILSHNPRDVREGLKRIAYSERGLRDRIAALEAQLAAGPQ